MKKMKISLLSGVILATIVVVSGFTKNTSSCQKEADASVKENKQTINMVVSHGHCSTPFIGDVENLKVVTTKRSDGGNPLEDMKISFEIDPNSFNVCKGEDLTARVRTPGLFINDNHNKIIFESTTVYTMGIDWYQVNGLITIKGVEQKAMFFATGIRDTKETMPSILVLEGQLNLLDWGIDYDKIVTGKSDPTPTKWMYMNMKIDMS